MESEMKKRVGAFVGKFYPPHKGHIFAIDTALKDMDEVVIVISSNKIRDNQIKQEQRFNNLEPEHIKSWFEEHYKNNSAVSVQIFDESGLRPYPLDRDIWAQKFKEQFANVNIKIGDESYREYNEQYFSDYEFYAVDRDVVGVHSTDIRLNFEKYKDYLIDSAKSYFENKGV